MCKIVQYALTGTLFFIYIINDYSMMEMDFGATIAMANADEEIKKVAKYMTKSNEEDGVAYVIDEMLKMYGL